MSDDNLPPKSFKDKQSEVKDRQECEQIMSYKAISLHTLAQMMHRAVEKGCKMACQFSCCSIDSLLCNRPAICSGQKEQRHTEEQHSAVAETWSAPSTILIVNISNSTLIDCVIGNETGPPTVAEKQPLMQGTIPDFHDPNRCSCNSASQMPSIQINSSNLSCVIIGDNNYMQVEQKEPSEGEPGEDSGDDS